MPRISRPRVAPCALEEWFPMGEAMASVACPRRLHGNHSMSRLGTGGTSTGARTADRDRRVRATHGHSRFHAIASVECAPDGGQDHAAVLTVCRTW